MPPIQNPTYYERVVIDNRKTFFTFNNLENFDRFIEEQKSMNKNNRVEQNFRNFERNNRSVEPLRWFGINDITTLSNNLDTFLYSSQLPNLLSNVSSQINSINISDLDQTKGIVFTEKEIGVFSFDLASLGLIPVYEYYSELMNEIVNPNLVKSFVNQEGTRIFYVEERVFIPQHKVEYDEKYAGWYSNILKKLVEFKELFLIDTTYYYPEKPYIPKHDVERRHKLDNKGKKRYSTTFKKSFIDIR